MRFGEMYVWVGEDEFVDIVVEGEVVDGVVVYG